MLNYIDSLLNKITMYRLVLYFLIVLLAASAIFGAFGMLPYSPLSITASAALLTLACWIVNGILAKIFNVQPNVESVYITALILALIITPHVPMQAGTFIFLVFAAVIAMGSKYILTIRKRHFLNPAAFAVATTGLALHQYASWWVGGNLPLFAFIIIGGLLVLRKIQRFDLALAYLGAAFGVAVIVHLPANPWETMQKAILHTPIFFFASIMITEPLTTPPTRGKRMIYGITTGIFYSMALGIGPVFSTPENALVASNILSYFMDSKERYALPLLEKRERGSGIYDFIFKTDKALDFRPGQYMEWTLGHAPSDSRGNRRYFTIASSPTESNLRLGVRFYEQSSTFKKAMRAMKPGDEIMAGELAGDFTLPEDPSKKLAFVAGGIGITPFRSMIKYLSDKNEKRDVVLLYASRAADEIVYHDVFDEANRKLGIKTIYAITGTESRDIPERNGNYSYGKMDPELLKNEVSDYRERIFYISGTHKMVTAFKKILRDIGVPQTQIKTDFFPGF